MLILPAPHCNEARDSAENKTIPALTGTMSVKTLEINERMDVIRIDRYFAADRKKFAHRFGYYEAQACNIVAGLKRLCKCVMAICRCITTATW